MPQREMKNHMSVVHLGNLTLSGTTLARSAWVDTREWDSCTFVLVSNTVTDAGTASGYSFEVMDSDTTATADEAAVGDNELIGTEDDLTVTSDSADNSVAGIIGYLGGKRYARITARGTTGTNADVSVIAILNLGSRGAAAAGVGTAVSAT